MMPLRRLVRSGIAVIALGAFFAALAFPAVGTCASSNPAVAHWFDNGNILFFGWMAALIGQVGWFANIPFFVNAVLLLCGRRPMMIIGILQTFFLAVGIITLLPRFEMRLPHNEGFDEPVCWLGTGFWLWVAAQALICVLSLAGRDTKTPATW